MPGVDRGPPAKNPGRSQRRLVALVRFSSAEFQTKNRTAAIRDAYSSIARIDIEPLCDDVFAFSGKTLSLPSLTISAMSTLPCKVKRRGEHTAYNSDLIVLGVATGGRLRAWQKGCEDVECAAGEAYLRGNDAPGGVSIDGQAPGILNIAIPHQRLARAVQEPHGWLRKPPPSSSLTLLIRYARMLLREGGDLSPAAAALASGHIRDLTVLALGGAPDAAERARKGGLRAARLEAVKADIAANVGNPRLSLDWLAGRHGISPRYLRALFYGDGTSLTDFILEARLSHAHRLLTRDYVEDRNIGGVALESGFGDLSWFHQTFRRRFAMTPADAREAARKDRAEAGERLTGRRVSETPAPLPKPLNQPADK
jgi:AraC-like DNA-binding protein